MRGRMLLVAALTGLVAAGCGGAIPSSHGASGVRLASNSDGSFLVDARGNSLYLFEGDEKNDSYCSGACAAVWPPLEADSKPQALAGVPATALGVFKRDDGESQVTYMGHPLYYYAGDASSPGHTKGEEAEQFGAEWYLVGPNGKPLEAQQSSGSKTTTTDNSGGGGY